MTADNHPAPCGEAAAQASVVLVVDDSKVILMNIVSVLEPHYRLLTASSGGEALQLAATEPRPDLILLDVVMPAMNGYEVLRQLRQNPLTADIPVVFLTAMTDDDNEEHGLDLGAVDYMTKPLRPAILLARTRNHLELKHSRDALRRHNELLEHKVMERTRLLRAILDSADQTIAMTTQNGTLLTINHVGAERFNGTPAQLVGRSIFDLLPGDIVTVMRECMTRAVGTGQPSDVKYVSGNRTLHTNVFPVAGEPPRLVIYASDISDYVASENALRLEREQLATSLSQQRELNKRLEDAQNQLLQSEKMASLGQLAAGVAHELNNPIGFVHSNLGTLDGYLKDVFEIAAACTEAIDAAPDSEQFDAVAALKMEKDFEFIEQDIFQLMSESRDGVNRMRKIVQDLKDFSHVGEADWQWADIHAGLDSPLNIVWNELKYKCTVTKHYADDLPKIYCLASQLNQVFMNLLVNAAHAIDTKGDICITTARSGDDSIVIGISDTGQGIASEHLSRIFDPFFTTKPVGKGTGLGLSIAWSIIGKHHGKIEVGSTLGKGTTFTIRLPVEPPVETAAEVSRKNSGNAH